MAHKFSSSGGGNDIGSIINVLIIHIFILICLTGHCINNNVSASANTSERVQPRTLIFPPTTPTRIQFIGGIGIPVEDLNFESVTSGYVLKAEYFLPTEAQVWHQKLEPLNIQGRSLNGTNMMFTTPQQQREQLPAQHEHNDKQKRNESNSNTKYVVNEKNQQLLYASSLYRWIIYQGIEQLQQRAGQSGRQCMLRSICEHASVPLHFGSGILAEVLHIILSPSSSQESLIKDNDAAYFEAERLGRASGECAHIYHGCYQSPMDYISAIFDID